MELAALAKQCLEDGKLWFPDVAEDLVHHSLSMCGEVGELANLVKKIHRGDLDARDASTHHKLVMENTDVLIYNLNIAAILKYDPMKAYEMKRRENAARFGSRTPSRTRGTGSGGK